MRPRPVGLGNSAKSMASYSRSTSFNEAETCRSRKFERIHTGCGLGLLASMRPRPVGLGNRDGDKEDRSRNPASMRPRPVGLGNFVAPGNMLTPFWLQ